MYVLGLGVCSLTGLASSNIPRSPLVARDEKGASTESAEAPQSLIIRASNGKSKKHRKDKIRLSTTVDPGVLDAFYARYAETCKAGMTLLKPRDKSKKKAKAKKKKAATATSGP